MRVPLTSAAILAVLLPLVAGTDGTAQQPTFRSGVDLILVDATVTDPGLGRPIRDLRKEDFTVTVDGRPRTVSRFEFTAFGTAEAAPAAETPARRQPYSSNETFTLRRPGRAILLVVDEEHIAPGGAAAAMAAARRFVDRLASTDRVGLSVIPASTVAVDFTTNRSRITEALKRVVGRDQAPPTSNTVSLGEAFAFVDGDADVWNAVKRRECGTPALSRSLVPADPDRGAACEVSLEGDANRIVTESRNRARITLGALEGLVDALIRQEGAKTLVFLSQGLPVGEGVSDSSDFLSDSGRLASAMSRARVSIYVLRLDRSSAQFDVSLPQASLTNRTDARLLASGLDTIAGMSGGRLFNVVGTGDAIFDRLALETSASYLLGIEPEAGDRDGRAHRIEVRVNRRGVSVRARSGFAFETAPPAPPSPEATLNALLASPVITSDIPLRVTTYSTKDPDSRNVRLMISADVDRNCTAPREVSVGFLLRDQQDRAKGGIDKRTLKPARASAPSPLAYLGVALVEPGSYTLRLAVVDAQGRRGNVEHPVEAALTGAGEFEVGDLVVVDPTDAADGSWRPAVDPVSSDGLVSLFVEVNGRDPARLRQARVRFEVAQRETGPAAVTIEGPLDPTDRPSRGTAQARLAVHLLPPGDYVGRATVRVAGKDVGRVVRPVRVVKAARSAAVATSKRERAPSKSTAADLVAAAALEPFRREQVLDPVFLGRFLDRLVTAAGPRGTGLTRAVEEARVGHFDAAADLVKGAPAGALEAPFLGALALFARNDLNGAAVQFRNTLTASPDFLPAVVYLGACYAAGGHDRDAAGAWESSLISESEVPEVYVLLADALLRLNDGEQARRMMLEATTSWPENVDLKRRLAAAYAVLGKEKEALAALDPYLDQHPEDHRSLFLALGLIYAAHAEGTAIDGPAEDRARFDLYARRYAAANGPNQAMVAEWQRVLK